MHHNHNLTQATRSTFEAVSAKDLKYPEQAAGTGTTQAAVEDLAQLIHQVHQELSYLDEILAPYLVYPVPAAEAIDACARDAKGVSTSPLIDQISTVYRMTQGLSERVRGLTERVP